MKRATEEHGVSRMNLQDQVLGNVEQGKKPGQQPYLNREEENLEKFVEVVTNTGFEKTRKQIIAMVEKAASDKKVLRKKKNLV